MKRRFSLAKSGLTAALLLALSLWATAAGATTLLKLGLDSLVANSDRIVVGDVVSIESQRHEGRIVTDIRVKVLEEWKGSSDAESTVRVRQPGGRVGDTVTRVYGMPRYREGERAVLFLDRAPNGEFHSVTGLRQGKFHIAVGPDGSTKFVVPRLDDVQLLEPKSPDGSTLKSERTSEGRNLDKIDASQLQVAKPAPIHRRVTPLEEFRRRVESNLAERGEQQ